MDDDFLTFFRVEDISLKDIDMNVERDYEDFDLDALFLKSSFCRAKMCVCLVNRI